MAVKTTQQQLEEVQAAITALLTGAQSYTIDGRTITKANLKDLHAREEVLLSRYNAESGNRPVITAMNLSGMGYSK